MMRYSLTEAELLQLDEGLLREPLDFSANASSVHQLPTNALAIVLHRVDLCDLTRMRAYATLHGRLSAAETMRDIGPENAILRLDLSYEPIQSELLSNAQLLLSPFTPGATTNSVSFCSNVFFSRARARQDIINSEDDTVVRFVLDGQLELAVTKNALILQYGTKEMCRIRAVEIAQVTYVIEAFGDMGNFTLRVELTNGTTSTFGLGLLSRKDSSYKALRRVMKDWGEKSGWSLQAVDAPTELVETIAPPKAAIHGAEQQASFIVLFSDHSNSFSSDSLRDVQKDDIKDRHSTRSTRNRSRSLDSSSSRRRISRRSRSRDDAPDHKPRRGESTGRRSSKDESESSSRHRHDGKGDTRQSRVERISRPTSVVEPRLHPAWKHVIADQLLRKGMSWFVTYYARVGKFVEALGFDSGLPHFEGEEVVLLTREPNSAMIPPADDRGIDRSRRVGTDFTSQERLAVQELCRPNGVYLSLEQIRWYVFDSPPEFAALIQLYAKLVACRDCFPRDHSRWSQIRDILEARHKEKQERNARGGSRETVADIEWNALNGILNDMGESGPAKYFCDANLNQFSIQQLGKEIWTKYDTGLTELVAIEKDLFDRYGVSNL